MNPPDRAPWRTDFIQITNFVQSSPSLKGADCWTPVCLPKMNASGFLHACVGGVRDPCTPPPPLPCAPGVSCGWIVCVSVLLSYVAFVSKSVCLLLVSSSTTQENFETLAADKTELVAVSACAAHAWLGHACPET